MNLLKEGHSIRFLPPADPGRHSMYFSHWGCLEKASDDEPSAQFPQKHTENNGLSYSPNIFRALKVKIHMSLEINTAFK